MLIFNFGFCYVFIAVDTYADHTVQRMNMAAAKKNGRKKIAMQTRSEQSQSSNFIFRNKCTCYLNKFFILRWAHTYNQFKMYAMPDARCFTRQHNARLSSADNECNNMSAINNCKLTDFRLASAKFSYASFFPFYIHSNLFSFFIHFLGIS